MELFGPSGLVGYTSERRKFISEEDLALRRLSSLVKANICHNRRQKKEDLVNKQSVLVLIAHEWCNNVKSFTVPETLLDSVYSGNGWMIWKKRQDLDNYFGSSGLNSRRNELILGGLKSTEAEKFLAWLKKLSKAYIWNDFDITLLGNPPKFTTAMDKELLTAISRQECLFMDESFINWDSSWTLNRKLHEEQLKRRFRFFKANWKELMKFFTFDKLYEQEIMQKFRRYYAPSIGVEDLPVREASQLIIEELPEFDGTKYLSWISLSTKFKCPDQTIKLKKLVENFLLSLPARPRDTVVGLKLKNLLTHEKDNPEGDENSVTNTMVRVVFNGNVAVEFPLDSMKEEKLKGKTLEQCKKLYKETRASLLKVYRLIRGMELPITVQLSLFDTLVFEYAKQWQTTSKESVSRKGIKNLQKAFEKSLSIKRYQPLSDAELASILENELNAETHGMEQEEEEIEAKTTIPSHSSAYAKKFCWRTVSNEEWKKMLLVIYRAELLDRVTDDESVWEFVVEKSKVSTGKSHQSLKCEFLEKVLPKVNTYFTDDVILNYFGFGNNE